MLLKSTGFKDASGSNTCPSGQSQRSSVKQLGEKTKTERHHRFNREHVLVVAGLQAMVIPPTAEFPGVQEKTLIRWGLFRITFLAICTRFIMRWNQYNGLKNTFYLGGGTL